MLYTPFVFFCLFNNLHVMFLREIYQPLLACWSSKKGKVVLLSACSAALLLANPLSINAQATFSFSNPMQIEPRLSANFGELRKNHFHSGLDYRTESRIGIPVYAVEDGYVCRIFVSPFGFGKALYINHGTKYTSVYAHLDSFSPEIEQYVKKQQYALESYSINDFPNKLLFPVKKGMLVGYSGNSGSSGGPHLHFEIRDQASEEPLNLLGQKLLSIEDHIPPKIKNILIYKLDTVQGVPIPSIFRTASTSKLAATDTVDVPESFFFGIESFDSMPNSSNAYFPMSIFVEIDSLPYFSFVMDRFAFDETKYINTMVDYEQLTIKGREIVRTLKDPNNSFSVLAKMKKNGIVKLDSNIHRVTVKVADFNKNEAECSFLVRKISTSQTAEEEVENQYPILVSRQINIAAKQHSSIKIPGASLYNSALISYNELNPKGAYGPAIVVGNPKTTPLKAPFELTIKASVPQKYEEKVFIARGSKASFSNIGGDYEKGAITTTSSEFGRFFIEIDTIAPKIVARNLKKKVLEPRNGVISFTVSDDKSGIDTFDIYIDEKWVIGEYDAKNKLVTIKLDPERIGTNRKHEIEFYIADKVGNTDFFQSSFYF